MGESVDFTDWGGMGLPGDTSTVDTSGFDIPGDVSAGDFTGLDLSALEAGGGDVSASDIPWDLNTSVPMDTSSVLGDLAAWFNIGGPGGVSGGTGNPPPTGGVPVMPDDGSGVLDAGTAIAVRRVPWGTIMAIVGAAVRYFGAQFAPSVIQTLASALQAKGLNVSAGQILFRFLKRKGRRRGTRGITGRQLAITRRTFRKVDSMYHLLHRGHYARARAAAPAYYRRRRRR